eukprot:RCo033539
MVHHRNGPLPSEAALGVGEHPETHPGGGVASTQAAALAERYSSLNTVELSELVAADLGEGYPQQGSDPEEREGEEEGDEDEDDEDAIEEEDADDGDEEEEEPEAEAGEEAVEVQPLYPDVASFRSELSAWEESPPNLAFARQLLRWATAVLQGNGRLGDPAVVSAFIQALPAMVGVLLRKLDTDELVFPEGPGTVEEPGFQFLDFVRVLMDLILAELPSERLELLEVLVKLLNSSHYSLDSAFPAVSTTANAGGSGSNPSDNSGSLDGIDSGGEEEEEEADDVAENGPPAHGPPLSQGSGTQAVSPEMPSATTGPSGSTGSSVSGTEEGGKGRRRRARGSRGKRGAAQP